MRRSEKIKIAKGVLKILGAIALPFGGFAKGECSLLFAIIMGIVAGTGMAERWIDEDLRTTIRRARTPELEGPK